MHTHSTRAIVRGFQQTIGTADFERHALEAMRSHCGAEKALTISHPRDGKPDALLQAPFLSERELDHYNRHYAADNPYIADINALPVGLVAATSSMLPIREYRKLPYFSWAVQSYGVYEIGAVVSRAGADSIAIGFSRSLAKGDFSADQLARLQSVVAPFRRAYFLHRRLRGLGSPDAARVATLIDLTDPHYGCFAINGDGVIVDQNAAADEHLANGSTVIRVRGRLRFTDPPAEQMLKAALARAALSEIIPLPSLGTEQRSATIVRVDDVNPAKSQRQHAHWLVFLPALQQSRIRMKVLAFADEHSLTDTEARVLEHLVQGNDVRAIASQLGHGLETCRSLLKHIFQKSGTRRQAELVARVLV